MIPQEFTLPEWAARNPFTNEYTREEIEHYGLTEWNRDGIRLETRPLTANPFKAGIPPAFGGGTGTDDYLNRRYREGEIASPVFYIDDQLWMSVTPMEVQSQHLAVQFAQDDVVALGLGLGHFTLRAMGKSEVNTITVYERDPRVVKFFTDAFSDRPGFDKVRFVLGDARETFKGVDCAFCYADIYQGQLADEVLTDIQLFTENNGIEVYHWWTRELFLLFAMQLGLVHPGDLDHPTRRFFLDWRDTPVEELPGRTLVDLAKFCTVPDPDDAWDYAFASVHHDFMFDAMKVYEQTGIEL